MFEHNHIKGLHLEGEAQVRVDDAYRREVAFDDILPGDLLVYRGEDMRYHLIQGRSRDHIHGIHFGGPDRSSAGGWSQEYREFMATGARLDRIAPVLVRPILRFYKQNLLAQDLEKGDLETN